MSGTIDNPPPVSVVDVSGITAPTFEECADYTLSGYKAIYGSDIYLGNDNPDLQLYSLLSLAIHDTNNMAVAIYNSFSPNTAQGNGLSNVVKINGLQRIPATNGQVDLTLTGDDGTEIINGVVQDANQVTWDLPPTVTIIGTTLATATCRVPGNIIALANTVTRIMTPTLGWTSATNVAPATPGNDIETDAQLRIRQQNAVALPSKTVLEGLHGAIASLPGVDTLTIYENFTGATDAVGVAAHSIAVVVEGGDVNEIAEMIYLKKTPGCGTSGTTTVVVTDPYGFPHNIKFSRPTLVTVKVHVDLSILGLNGYVNSIGEQIKASLLAYMQDRRIGGDGGQVRRTRLYVPASLSGPYAPVDTLANAAASRTYEIASLKLAKGAAALAEVDIPITYYERPVSVAADITLTVLVE